MKTVKAFRTGEIVADIKNQKAVVPFKVGEDGNPATMCLRLSFREVKLDLWYFDENPGDCQGNFSCYKVFQIEVDYSEIAEEVKKAFKQAEEKAEEQKREAAKLQRAENYENNTFVSVIMPQLKEDGYEVTCTTKEEYVEKGADIALIVNGAIHVNYDYRGRFTASNRLYDSRRVERQTKSAKLEKMLEAIKDAVSSHERLMKEAKKEKEALNNKKTELEKLLGEQVIEKTENHRYKKGSRYTSYETKHFVRVVDNVNYYAMKIKPFEKDGKRMYNIENLPALTPEKLKKLIKLLDE